MATLRRAGLATGGSAPDDTWWHLWVSATRLHSRELSRLLRLAAGDGTAGVIITTAGMDWLYSPYDGGADVIAATAEHRNPAPPRARGLAV